jgi:DDE superfamily endonuclease/Helix-turn-helix of DDE superfamily endonuclease
MQNTKLSQTNYRFMLSLTSLTAEEFIELLSHFDLLWQRYHAENDLQGRPRRKTKSREHESMSLQGSSIKLLFVLIYLKNNPLQSYHGLAFNMSQGKVSQWLGVLLPLVEEALCRARQLPDRTPGHLYLSLQLLSGQLLLMDATERAVPRAIDKERQQLEYSGKKGCHTNKNLLVVSEQGQVLYLSPTVEGSQHDKALADELELEFVAGQPLLLDLGFLGYQPKDTQVFLPEKKPPKGQLTDHQKAYNQLLASMRVSVEHVISGVKRLRIVKDKIRLKKDHIRDQVMLIACGLHNLRIAYRNLS